MDRLLEGRGEREWRGGYEGMRWGVGMEAIGGRDGYDAMALRH